jgi:hypothetical protein
VSDNIADKLLNTVHVPDDAGVYADRLRKMLERIPDNWGRWVSFDRGWYPLVCQLDSHISRILPDYQIHQMKEKFGGLRFYWAPHWVDEIEPDVQERERRRAKEVEALVDAWEIISYLVCEACGAEGSLHDRDGWYKTLCHVCAGNREGEWKKCKGAV